MKPKKKAGTSVKKTTKKPLAAKPIMLFDKTIVTTKQKTYNTIEDHFQMIDVRGSFRSNKSITPRTLCQEKMEECNMSPFSNSGGSKSPKYGNAHSPHLKEEKERKKSIGKHEVIEKPYEKRKGQAVKRVIKAVPKMTKEQQNQSAYQMLLLKRLGEKKITEMSQQSSISIPKFTKLQLNIANVQESKRFPSNSHSIIRQLKQKIQQKYSKQFPTLKRAELTFLCSIVLVQRFWRQCRIKNLISQYISAKTDPSSSSADSHTQIATSKLDAVNSTQQHTSELIKKYHFLNIGQEKNKIEKQRNNTQSPIVKQDQAKLNLKSLQLSADITPQKQAKMIKFVECLRDITYFKRKKSEKKSKINVFNLQQSLSQKCLMQKLYEKLFKDGQSKKNNFEIFSSKKEEKHLQRSIELISTMKTHKKERIIQQEQQLQTQLQDTDQIAPIERVSVSVDTEDFTAEDKAATEINTLKQLSLVSQGVIFMLLNQFSSQFYDFTSRSILRKKKKMRMPGLKVTNFTIKQYLAGLTDYMLKKYDAQVIRRFCLIKPLSFLKIHHEYDQEEQQLDEEEDELNMPIVPNNLFYEYQLIYEDKIFSISEEDKKYCNFLEGLVKINNLLLANCLSQFLEKARMDKVVLPWDNKFQPERSCKKKKYSKDNLKTDLKNIIQSICSMAFLRVGQFHKRLDDPEEERKMMGCINQEYKSEGNDWSAQYQYLEMRMQLTKFIEEQLLNQITNDLIIFY